MSKTYDQPFRHQVDCYVKWLRLRISKEYRKASQDLRQLQADVDKAEERFSAAHAAYLPYLPSSEPRSAVEQFAEQEYRTAHESHKNALEAQTTKNDETCNRFGLIRWWDPNTPLTMEDADCIISPSFSVMVVDPPPDMRVDWNSKIDEEGRRTLAREGTWSEPPRKYTKADKEGWLTLKVNLNAPLEESERAIKRILRVNRANPPKSRSRHDKVAEALQTLVCYEETQQFSLVVQRLQRPTNTVKGQYVRACVLIYGERPTGSMKERRAGIVRDPAADYQAHYGSCSRCQKANTADKMCRKFRAFVDQHTKAELDTRASRELAKYGKKGRRRHPAKHADEIMQ